MRPSIANAHINEHRTIVVDIVVDGGIVNLNHPLAVVDPLPIIGVNRHRGRDHIGVAIIAGRTLRTTGTTARSHCKYCQNRHANQT